MSQINKMFFYPLPDNNFKDGIAYKEIDLSYENCLVDQGTSAPQFIYYKNKKNYN